MVEHFFATFAQDSALAQSLQGFIGWALCIHQIPV